MFSNYWKTAVRNLLRNASFALTNIVGLTIGITCTILIVLWVYDERTYDRFHNHYDNIYQVIANRDFNNQIFTDRSMVLPLASVLENSSPMIKHAVVTTYQQENILTYKDKMIKKNGYEISEHFFDVFTWEFVKGNAASALKIPHSIILTDETAKAYFGDEDPINKIMKLDNQRSLTVSAVVKKPASNSTFQFDWLTPFNYDDPDTKRMMEEWQGSRWNVFLQTTAHADTALLNKHVTGIKRARSKDAISSYFLFPMDHWHLYSDFQNGKNTGGMIEYVQLFSIIAIVILLIACINFMNFSTARSEKRAKEVGIRKTLGSTGKQLIAQFYIESFIITGISFVLSIALVALLLPLFNGLVDKQLSLNLLTPLFWLMAFAIVLFTALVAGSYPALYLSSFQPVKVLKGTLQLGKNSLTPRRVLVTFQFVISILLISATIIVYRQLQHVKDRDMGYEAERLVMFPSTPDTDKNFTAIKNELLASGDFTGVTRSSSPLTQVWWNTGAPDYEGKPDNAQIIMGGLETDIDFTKTVGARIIQGHDFTGTPADSASMILNKAAVEAMQLKNPIGMQMRFGRNFNVIGVMDNIIMASPFEPPYPMLILFNGGGSARTAIRIGKNIPPQRAIASLEKTLKKHNPSVPFEYQFVDQDFQQKFVTEELIGKLTNIFSGLAIFICCLGIVGLASFTIEKRFKEMGVRKVLGANVSQLLLLISQEFLKTVVIAFVIAVPLTYWLMHYWLAKYNYHTTISWWVFAVTGVGMFLLTLLIVSVKTWKAAYANPIKSLRTE